MELIVLGSSAAYPEAGGAASGYLLSHDGFNLCLDLGTGTLAALQKHIDVSGVHGVVISHAHWDHFLDLYPLYVARFYRREEPAPAIPLVAPTGFFDFMMRLVHAEEGKENVSKVFDVREVDPGGSAELGPFRIDTRLLPHWVTNIGTRIAADGTSIVYTGDTGPTEDIEVLGREADLMIAEASWQDRPEGVEPFHLTAREAARHAARAEARKLMLSHFWPGSDREVSRAQAQEEYQGDMVLANQGVSVELPA